MGELHEQEHRAQIGSHNPVPLLDRGLDQWLGHLDRSIVDEGIERGMECPGLLKNELSRFGSGDIRLDKTAVLWEILPKFGAVHTDHAPAFCRKVIQRRAPDSPSGAGDENSFCHRVFPSNFFCASMLLLRMSRNYVLS